MSGACWSSRARPARARAAARRHGRAARGPASSCRRATASTCWRPAWTACRATIPAADVQLIVLDNGSAQADAIAYLEQLQQRPNVEGGAAARPVQFLRARQRRRARGARAVPAVPQRRHRGDRPRLARADAGVCRAARGRRGRRQADLSDGRLQHGGVVLGLDGFAGHAQRLLGADDPAISASLHGRARFRR